MGIPHYKMDLPEIYPVNAVSYNAAAVEAKKAKEQMERAQKELENRLSKPVNLSPEEKEEFIQSIMEAIIDDDEKMRMAAKKRRNAMESLPALEDFERRFAASSQVRRLWRLAFRVDCPPPTLPSKCAPRAPT